MPVNIFGIRHHGPGSARGLRRALAALRPDIVLIEGPPDADDLLPLLAEGDAQPPLALLIYLPATPRRAVYYPFASFSPEWQALRYGFEAAIPLRWMDLPQRYQLAAGESLAAPEAEAISSEPSGPPAPELTRDPLAWLAEEAGYSDGERWWEHMVEQRRDDAGLFAAILEAIGALRATLPARAGPLEEQREAWMRQSIRAAEAEGYRRIAVVCGAWHAPALGDLTDAHGDEALLAGLPSVETAATLTPWTYGRLALASGYGAGVASPGWYDHLFATGDSAARDVTTRWMTKVARLLREQDLDASSAHAIEAVRLAEALAALRGHPLPGLDDLSAACQAVFCFGSDLPMRLIHERLIVGERMGSVPAATPLAPLQHDLQREQKRLRLAPEAADRDLELDLRKPNDLERSHLLRRLSLLGIGWGRLQGSRGRGTFRELWRLRWEPELSVALIEAGIWGNTIADAACARALAVAEAARNLPALVGVVNQALLSDMPAAVGPLMAQLRDQAALASDVTQLMDALTAEDRATHASLVSSLRYGNVRKTDAQLIEQVVDGIVARCCIGLPLACAALDDDAAAAMLERIVAVNSALQLLQNQAHLESWHGALLRVADMPNIHGLVAGRCCRILLDAQVLDADEAARRLLLAIGTATPPAVAAAWVEGLLTHSGLILLHDARLWGIVDGWLTNIPAESFVELLPLLRRTFATFSQPERRQLGERARRGRGSLPQGLEATTSDPDFDAARAAMALPLIAQMLGLTPPQMEERQ
jgi:hypothetical protein